MKISQVLVSAIALSSSSTHAYTTTSSRRAFVQAAGAAAVVWTTTTAPANALEACPKGSNNCIRTTWSPPAGTSKADMAKTVQEVLAAYPQEGQADVDKGGWTIVSDDLAGSGTAALEYKSGMGNLAKFLNGGKPFVDDLKLEIADGAVQVRSSSRVGDSDFKVNQKRLQYLGNALQAKGWTVPAPTY